MAERALQAAILAYLDSKRSSAPDPEGFEVATDVLREAFSLPPSSTSSTASTELLEVWMQAKGGSANTAGADSPSAQPPRDEDLQADPRFRKFLEVLTAKGFFGGAEPGTAEYKQRYAKVVEKFNEKARGGGASAGADGAAAGTAAAGGAKPPAAASSAPAAAGAAANSSSPSSQPNDDEAAEQHKAKGNELLAARKFGDAAECYSRAIAAAPTGKNAHIYYANRSAAWFGAKNYDKAEEDARECVRIDPSYAKGHNRLASALEGKGKVSDAIAAYEKCLDIEPSNAVAKENMAKLKGKLAASATSSSSTGGGRGGGAGRAGGMGGMGGMPGGMGGMGDILNNPMFASMAQNLMKDPNAMANLMKNPMVQQMARGMGMGGMGAEGGEDEEEEDLAGASPPPSLPSAGGGGGGGGGGVPGGLPPSLAGLANDPELAPLMADPDVRAMMEDVQRGGMGAAMAHMGKPGVMAAFSKIMGKMGK